MSNAIQERRDEIMFVSNSGVEILSYRQRKMLLADSSPIFAPSHGGRVAANARLAEYHMVGGRAECRGSVQPEGMSVGVKKGVVKTRPVDLLDI